jgi:hypothetical protein
MALPPNDEMLVVGCPVCGSGRIDDAPTTPNISLKVVEAFAVDQANLVPGDRVDPMLLELCTKPMGTQQRATVTSFMEEPTAKHLNSDPVANLLQQHEVVSLLYDD